MTQFIRFFSTRDHLLYAITLVLGMLCFSGDVSSQDLQRGLRNYQEILGGKKKLEQLTPEEQREVFLIHRRRERARTDGGSGSSECADAKSRADSAATELANYARRLRNCAEAQDFSDDCSSEFRRVRNAHSEYESVVSSFVGACR
jgi:hypothetical protein